MPIMCSICLCDSHHEHHYPYLLFSADVNLETLQESSAGPPRSYASAAKTPRMVRSQSTLDKGAEMFKEKEKAKGKGNRKEKENGKQKSEKENRRQKSEKENGRQRMQKENGRHKTEKENGEQKTEKDKSCEYERESREKHGRDDNAEWDRKRDQDRDRGRKKERYRDRSCHHHHWREHSQDEDRRRRSRDRDWDRDHLEWGREPDFSEEGITDSDGEWIPVRGRTSRHKHH